MSKFANNQNLIDLVVELRDAGTPWDKQGGIVTQVQARFPEYTSKSAIPLRKLYHAAKADPVKATKARVIAGRKAGKGWARLSVELNAPVSALKKLAEGTEWAEGRVYVATDGSTNIVDLAAAKAEAKDEADTEVEAA
jgi:hypothetical protein